MNEAIELIREARENVKRIAKVSKEVGKDTDREKVVCYYGEDGAFRVKRSDKGWSIPGEIEMPANATQKQIADYIQTLNQ